MSIDENLYACYKNIMLKALKIKNMAVIESLEIDFSDGLNLFTGETGAGKSIIVDALGLICGDRMDSDFLRTDADNMSIEAIFSIDKNDKVKEILKNFGFESDTNELSIRRELKNDGRSRALVNGTFSTSRFLKQIGLHLVEIHGQHQHQRLLDKQAHLDVLDGFLDTGELRQAVYNIYEKSESVRKQLLAIRQDEQMKAQRIDMLTFQINELESAALVSGEEEKLEQEKQVLSNAEFLFRNAWEAYQALEEGEMTALSALEQAKKNLARVSDISPEFEQDFELVESTIYSLRDTAAKLRQFSENTAPDANRLTEVENRLALLKRLQKKYGNNIPEMLEFLENAKQELEDLNTSEEKEVQLEEELEKLRRAYVEAALKLREERKKGSEFLKTEVEKQLSVLAMERTEFAVKITPLSGENEFVLDGYEYTPGPYGLDEIEFFIAPNVGEELKPLARIASGGELSRIMLALESVFKEKPTGRTLIFDEVDSGIGGRVAEIVGRKLRFLSYNNQIICVTHLPQVAAYANAHYNISKKVKTNRTFTSVIRLERDERIREIARMLGGINITETTLQQAKEFLEKV